MQIKRLDWSDLNERQQQYLLIIYQTDQLQEHNAKGIMRLEQRSIPADQWRWIEYADTYAGHTRLKQRLVDVGVVDQGGKLDQTSTHFEPKDRKSARIVGISGLSPDKIVLEVGSFRHVVNWVLSDGTLP